MTSWLSPNSCLRAGLDSLPVDKKHKSASLLCFSTKSTTPYQWQWLALKLMCPSMTPRHNPPPPPRSSLSLSINSVDIHWWWMGPICRLSILPTSITPGSPQVALTWAPPLIPGGPRSINPFFNMSAGQLPSGWDQCPVSSILLSAAPGDWCFLHLRATRPVRYGNEDICPGWWRGW